MESAHRDPARVSVIIPSFNRPTLLREAIGSVSAQTHDDWEIVVIDDASTPPIDLSDLEGCVRQRIIVLRNDVRIGQAASRERAEPAATGEFVLQLDDDDLLASTALERSLAVMGTAPDIDILFLNVTSFGTRSVEFEQTQKNALDRVLQRAQGERKDEIIRFDRRLFPALLKSVPMAFQRPMARREAWRRVTQFRRSAYDPDHRLEPPLREAEWALYAAANRTVALLTQPLYLQRCERQGYFSVETMRRAAEQARTRILTQMLRHSLTQRELAIWRGDIKRALAQCHFEEAYASFHRGQRRVAAGHLIKAISVRPSLAHSRFALRILLPRRIRSAAHV